MTLNPHTEYAQSQSVRFAVENKLTDSTKVYASKIAYLAGYIMPDASKEDLVRAANWITWFCLLDDVIESRAWEMGHLGRFLTDDNDFGRALEKCQICSDDTIAELLASFKWENSNRRFGLVPSLDQYQRMRSITVGVRPLLEFRGVTCEPLCTDVALAIGYHNDIATWPREQAAGEVHNLVRIAGQDMAIELHNLAVGRVFASSSEIGWEFVEGHMMWAEMTGRYRKDYQP